MKTIIDILSKGNLELFHSAFLGWLMDGSSVEHGLGNKFLTSFLAQVTYPNEAYKKINLECDYKVFTEYPEGRCRFDILVKNDKDEIIRGKKGIVFENKVKSFGSSVQVDNYREMGYEVIIIAYLPETISSKAKNDYPFITYSEVRDILKDLKLSRDNKFHIFISEYLDYLEHSISIYDNLRNYSEANIDFNQFRENISGYIQDVKLLENDIRTFTYFYYYNLGQHIRSDCTELVFGDLDYKEAEKINGNTSWQYEKNVQGPPYMEALLRNPFSPKFKMHPIFKEIYNKKGFTIVPRIELRIDLEKICSNEKQLPQEIDAGRLMLGSWDQELKNRYRSQPPYNTNLKRPKKSKRTDHLEKLSFADITFSNIEKKIRDMLMIIGDFA